MDSRAVASALGTDAKTLRRFLRSDASSVTPVGSGGRYTFDDDQMDTMRAEFGRWVAGAPVKVVRTRTARTRTPVNRDQMVWDDEGPVVLPDIRNPHVLRSVRVSEAARVRRLTALMRQAGLTTTGARV